MHSDDTADYFIRFIHFAFILSIFVISIAIQESVLKFCRFERYSALMKNTSSYFIPWIKGNIVIRLIYQGNGFVIDSKNIS